MSLGSDHHNPILKELLKPSVRGSHRNVENRRCGVIMRALNSNSILRDSSGSANSARDPSREIQPKNFLAESNTIALA